MAVGYNYLYVMTRILNEKKPESVLDIGLGISSTLISRYFDYYKYPKGKHIILEHDSRWVDFYTQNHTLSANSNICLQNLVKKSYRNVEYNAYESIGKDIANRKFSVISIDGPFGSKKYSRRDVLEFCPDILEDSFVLVFDDANRDGEKNTIEEAQSILRKHRIEHHIGYYPGVKHVCVIASEDNKFLCTL